MKTSRMKLLSVATLLLCIAGLLSIEKAHAQGTNRYYVYNIWKGKNNVAYITSVYAVDIPDYRRDGIAHYFNEINSKFRKSLEADGVSNVEEYWLTDVPNNQNESDLKDARIDFIAKLKREGYTVKISEFSWKPQKDT